MQIKFERRLSQGLQAVASYTWSHSIDIASTDAFANYLNTPSLVANPNIDRGSSDFDIRHALAAGLTYNLPSPGWNSAAHAALGGWSVDRFIFARSAPPVDLIGGLVYQDGIALYPRPDVVPGVAAGALRSRNIQVGRFSTAQHLPSRSPDNRATSDATYCVASEPHKRTSRSSVNFS